jgi:hypothetical protein
MGLINRRVLFYGGILAGIGLLAAINLPCFLEAKVRSKVARMHTDMRTVIFALEAYKTDHGTYPLPDPGENGWTMLPAVLTTPTGYLKELPVDMFDEQKGTIGYAVLNVEPDAWKLIEWDKPHPPAVALLSLGPTGERGAFGVDWNMVYDPTNGTTSPGYLFGFGGEREVPEVAVEVKSTYDPTNGTMCDVLPYLVKQ